jgi:acyl transferase domain-containing protein
MSPPDVRTLLKNAFLRIDDLERKLAAHDAENATPIAVLGIGCRFPAGGNGPDAYFAALERGADGVRRIGSDRWAADALPADRLETRWAGLLDEIDRFDASFFGISPREAIRLDPQQRLLLEVTLEAIEHAGQETERLFGSKTGVFVGMTGADYSQIVRDVGEYDMYCATGNLLSTAAGRIAYTLGLQGPCLTVDTACSSSLVAVHLGCQSLRQKESDLAVVAGVNIILDPAGMAMLIETQALSPDGRCKTFDTRANGFVRGEGCGMVVLKAAIGRKAGWRSDPCGDSWLGGEPGWAIDGTDRAQCVCRNKRIASEGARSCARDTGFNRVRRDARDGNIAGRSD